MSKLLKLSETHYIIVDDSEIKEGDLNIPSDFSKIEDVSVTSKEDLEIVNDRQNGYLKITHSTQPLESYIRADGKEIKVFVTIREIYLSEVEEVINCHSVDTKASEWIDKNSHKWSNNTDEVGDNYGSFMEGYNQCLRDNADKKYTEEDVLKAIKLSKEDRCYNREALFKQLAPQTIWEVTFDEQGDLKLL